MKATAEQIADSSTQTQREKRGQLASNNNHNRQDFVAEAGASRKSVGHGNFFSGLKLSGERGGGLGLARFSAVCLLGGHMYANGLLWHAGMAGAACMGLTT
jgi:hypothetical protein